MPATLISPGLLDSAHHAALANNISAFLLHDLCDCAIFHALLPHAATFLPHLALRLKAYGWQLDANTNLEPTSLSKTSSPLHVWNAGKAMKDLAGFLGMWSYALMKGQLSFANEASLKDDLERVARFLEALCDHLPELWDSSDKVKPLLRAGGLRGGGEYDDMLAALKENTAITLAAEKQFEASEVLNDPLSPPRWTVSSPTIPRLGESPAPEPKESDADEPAVDVQGQSRKSSTDSDISILELSPRPARTIPEARFLLPIAQLDPPTPPPSDTNLTLPSLIASGSSRSYVPHRLCANKNNTGHATHPLDGPRYKSRCGIASDHDFTEHCLKYGKWIIDRPIDPPTTVQIGHDGGVAFHSFEAQFLGFKSVKAIKIMHPLCAMELVGLDWDVMRAVAVQLRQYINKKAVVTSLRKDTVQQAEKKSLDMVEREVEARRRERKRAAETSVDSVMSGASGSRKDSPPTRTSFHWDSPNLTPPLSTLTLSSKLQRPEYNTRRCERRARKLRAREPHNLTSPFSKDESSGVDASHSHPYNDSSHPGTGTNSDRDSGGKCMGQYPVYEQDTRSLRSSNGRGRVPTQVNETPVVQRDSREL